MSFPLRVLSPEGPIFSDEVEAIQVTAFEGSLGVLPGHAPMLSALKTGPAKFTRSGKELWYVLGDGTLEVRPPEVILLVDYAEKAASADEAKRLAAADRDEA